MNSCELAAAITAIACSIANCAPEDDLPVLASAYMQLGDTLATISAVRERNALVCKKSSDTKASDADASDVDASDVDVPDTNNK